MVPSGSNSMQKPFQRVGSKSNSQVGKDFELIAKNFFSMQGIELQHGHKVLVGVNEKKKAHSFDLGCASKKWIVECKSHRWTSGNNVPSAKMTVWNEAMYYFLVAPPEYKKVMFVLRHVSESRSETLLQYYLNTYSHLIPPGVEFWEYDENTGAAVRTII